MDSKVREHVLAYCKRKGYEVVTDSDIMEIVTEQREVFRENLGSHRWYDDLFVVVELDGMFIGFSTFHTTGDAHWSDMGLELDPGSLCEVEQKMKMVMYYEIIKRDE